MATPINDFQDILDAMERNPALREALRRLILDDELRQMPVRLERIEADIADLKEGQTRLEKGQTRLEGQFAELQEGQTRLEAQFAELEKGQARLQEQVTRIGGDVSNLKGDDYESFVAEYARRYLWRELRTLTMVFSTQKDRENLTRLVTEAEVLGQILGHEADSLARADLILTIDETQEFILAEISLTVEQKDIDRAQEGASILTKATGRKVTPIAIGAAEDPNLDKRGLQVLLVQQHQNA